MSIHESKREAEALREIRVKMPREMHAKLHRLRLLRGKGISEAVTEALDLYLSGTAGARRPRLDREPRG